MLSSVPTNGIFDKHLSLVDICHIVVTVHLYKYWPRISSHRQSEHVTQVKKKSPMFVYLPIRDLSLRSHDSFLFGKLTSEVCVDSQYYSVRQVTKCTSRGNTSTMKRQTFDKRIQAPTFTI